MRDRIITLLHLGLLALTAAIGSAVVLDVEASPLRGPLGLGARFIGVALSLGSTELLFRSGERLFSARAGVLAGATFALLGQQVLWAAALWDKTLIVHATAWAVFWAAKLSDRPRHFGFWAGLSIAAGTAMLLLVRAPLPDSLWAIGDDCGVDCFARWLTPALRWPFLRVEWLIGPAIVALFTILWRRAPRTLAALALVGALATLARFLANDRAPLLPVLALLTGAFADFAVRWVSERQRGVAALVVVLAAGLDLGFTAASPHRRNRDAHLSRCLQLAAQGAFADGMLADALRYWKLASELSPGPKN